MIKKEEELRELLVLVNDFLKLADTLMNQGKITKEQYKSMTENKIRFLDVVQEKLNKRKNIDIQKNLFF
ncbi:hypothetical protein SAMN02745883_01746 [Caminicella sporogenes DSM 14501]|uniref:Uncharacterized protein n=1 Tax=Caminicella sporogenes DSM 14501 TaxID=1121266 RepID=A0A1M6R9T3_9FIRM|nr:hypothetical protein [Caminicella sporogenes]RKD27352.1 hypothetical protein BET04_09460 [Caminicella sporogenes]WIF94212.1 hypothetical protein QNI18_07835 [Caminicella sporogenes]SHK29186.1 hypothetical protein SAMN02745883_01746 [Caminicella sporogenes DSM 14501]